MRPPTTTALSAINLTVAFVLELVLLAAIGYWGFHLRAPTAVNWLLGVGAPVLVALIWSLIAAPRASRRLRPKPLVGFKLVVFTLGAVALYASSQHTLAILLEVVVLTHLGAASAPSLSASS
jgi:hypothetical protein